MEKQNDVIYNTTDGNSKPVSFFKRPRSKARNSVYVAGGFALAAVGISTVIAPAAELVTKLEKQIIPELGNNTENLSDAPTGQISNQQVANFPALSPAKPGQVPAGYKVPSQVLPPLPSAPAFDNTTSATPVGGNGGEHEDGDEDEGHDSEHDEGHDD